MTSNAPHNEPERAIQDAELGLTCRIYGQAPVQAEGRIGRAPFYFRARHSAWTFTVSISHNDIDPSALPPREETPGFFTINEYRGYFLGGDYGNGDDASFMRYDEVERIVRECAKAFLQSSAE
jgi:hypothetical protein